MPESVANRARNRQEVHPVDEVLPAGKMLAFGLQHVMTIYAGVIAVPLVVATAINLPSDQLVYIIKASFFMCGVATLIQAVGFWKFGARLPVVQGTSFTAVTPIIAIGQEYGIEGIFGSVIAAGIFTVFVAPYFVRFLKYFPPVVTGVVITIIGISLMPTAVQWCAGGSGAADFGSPNNIGLALFTLITILLITRFTGNLLGGFLSRIAILIGLVLGTLLATAFGAVNYTSVGEAGWVGITVPLNFGLPIFAVVPILAMALVMLIIATETTADVLALGEITGRRAEADDIARALRADGLSTSLGGIFNTFPFSAFAQNVGLVRFTGIKSRFVVAAAGGILILMGLLPKVAGVVAAIPLPVLGGAGLVLFGSVAAAGVQTLSKVDLTANRNLIIVAVAIALGTIPATVPNFYKDFPEFIRITFNSGITAAAISAVLLNLLFNVLGKKEPQETGDYGENMADVGERMTVMGANQLDREEFVERFAPLFQGARWVPEKAYEGHPFSSLPDLRQAFETAVYDAPEDRRVELLRLYVPLIRPGTAGSNLTALSLREQKLIGLADLSPEEKAAFLKTNEQYWNKFGFPFIAAIRDHTKETLLENARTRLPHDREQEILLSTVEVMKIVQYRLQDMWEDGEIRPPEIPDDTPRRPTGDDGSANST
ncbi:MAG: 2-oxo-4-hydroxy-4-carboxy-5-ureidoimidazoline decarboxylase [Rubrobacteraceae bacterium]